MHDVTRACRFQAFGICDSSLAMSNWRIKDMPRRYVVKNTEIDQNRGIPFYMLCYVKGLYFKLHQTFNEEMTRDKFIECVSVWQHSYKCIYIKLLVYYKVESLFLCPVFTGLYNVCEIMHETMMKPEVRRDCITCRRSHTCISWHLANSTHPKLW